MISGNPNKNKKEWREENWSGTYNYREMLNERKVYQVSFTEFRKFSPSENNSKVVTNIQVLRGMRKMKMVNTIAFGSIIKYADGN